MDFFDTLAEAKYAPQSNSEYILPGQRGKAVVKEVINKSDGIKTSVILVGQITEASSKLVGGATQAPGTDVKLVYSVSKYAFHIDKLLTDLCNIMGVDPKKVPKGDLPKMLRAAVSEQALKGVLFGFDSYIKSRADKGKEDITVVVLSHIPEGQGNSEAEVAARAKSL